MQGVGASNKKNDFVAAAAALWGRAVVNFSIRLTEETMGRCIDVELGFRDQTAACFSDEPIRLGAGHPGNCYE